MRTLRILWVAGLIAILAPFTLAHASPADAGRAPSPALHSPFESHIAANYSPALDLTGYNYDIEAYDYYCTGGGAQCVAGVGLGRLDVANCGLAGSLCAGLNYADAEFYGPPTGATSGTPVDVYAECERFTSSAELYSYDEVAPTYSYNPNADLGTITGSASLLDWFQQNPGFPGTSEGNPTQQSSGSVSIFDTSGVDQYGSTTEGAAGSHATIYGVMNTDNTTDTLNSGGFNITITSKIYVRPYNGSPYTYWGTMSCQAGGARTYDLYNAGYALSTDQYFEGELEYQ